MKYIKLQSINKNINKIDIPIKTKQKNTIESVSEINGTAIPLYYEYIKYNNINILDFLLSDNNNSILQNNDNSILDYIDNNIILDKLDNNEESNLENKNKESLSINNIKNNIKNKNLKINELLYLTNRWITYKNGYLYKILQITNYDWLSEDKLNQCIKNLDNLNLSNNVCFEKFITISFNSDLLYDINLSNDLLFNNIDKFLKDKISILENNNNKHLDIFDVLLSKSLCGYIDCFDDNNIYEFKCVNELNYNHYIQLALYAFVYELNIKLKKISIFNVNDIVIYKINNNNDSPIYTGKILKIFKNGKYNILNLNSQRKIKLNSNLIIRNISYIQQYKNIVHNNYYIYNILTNQLYKLLFNFTDLTNIFINLIYHKYIFIYNLNDDKFLINILNILDKFIPFSLRFPSPSSFTSSTYNTTSPTNHNSSNIVNTYNTVNTINTDNKDNINKYTVKQLKKIATDNNIKNRSKMKKQDLINAILSTDLKYKNYI
jgi:hypothetical protein